MRRVEADETVVAVRSRGRCRSCPTCAARRSTQAYRAGRGATAWPSRQVKARDLYGRMMRTLAQTGNGWMTFKDAANRRLQPDRTCPGNVVHLSNLCTEILEVTSDDETAVCNLGSINLGAHLRRRRRRNGLDCDKLRAHRAHRGAVPRPGHRHQLLPDRTQAAASNPRWRPVGLGVMGLQDVFFQLRLPFDSPEAPRAVDPHRRGDLLDRAGGVGRAGRASTGRTRPSPRPAPRAASCSSTSGASTPSADRAVGRRCGRGSPRTACATRCWSRSRRRRPSPRSPAATSASSRRSRTCSSARRCRASSCRSTATGARAQGAGAVDRRRCATRSSGPRARSRASPALPGDAPRRSTAPPGSCRSGRSSTWPPTAAPFIDQSQSLNLFLAAPTIGKLSSMYLYAWKAGPEDHLLPAVAAGHPHRRPPSPPPAGVARARPPTRRIACSLENPETCEACQ